MSSTAPSPPPVPEKTPVRPYYAPLVPSPLNPKNCFQTPPPTSPPGSPSPRTPPPKRPSLRRPASQTSPTQILLRQKAAAAFRSESLIKAYSSNNNNNNNNYISLGSSRRHASSRNPFLNMIQHQNLTTADTIDILYSLDIDDDDDTNPTGDLGLITPGNNTSNKPLPPVPMPPPLFSSSSPGQDPNSDSPPEREDHRLQEKDDLDLLSSTPYYEDYDYDHRDKEEIDLENGCYFERERATLPSGRTASFDDSGGRGRSTLGKARRGGGSGAEHRSGVTRLVIHLGRGLVILGIVIWFVLLHGLLRTFGGARRPPPPDSSLGSASDLEA